MSNTETKKDLRELSHGMAPILNEAPRVSSGPKTDFKPLLELLDSTPTPFRLKQKAGIVKLQWPGVKVSPGQLVALLKGLPRGGALDGATRCGQSVASYSFNGKLRRSKLAPPGSDGLILLWRDFAGSLEPLEKALLSQADFTPLGERLGSLPLELEGTKVKAIIYRSLNHPDAGFTFLREGRVVMAGGWFGLLEDSLQAPHCQVVLEGPLAWTPEFLSEWRKPLAKVARIAQQKSAQMDALEAESPPFSAPSTLPDTAVHVEGEEWVDRVLESPRFAAGYGSHAEARPPLVTIRQILSLLSQGAGQVSVAYLQDRIGLPDHRCQEILLQLDAILRKGEEVVLSLSLDRKTLLMDQGRLTRLFALEVGPIDPRVIRGQDLNGTPREMRLPLEPSLKERRVLEALLRYGKLSESELAQLISTRRVGGLLEKLLSRLEDAGFFSLRVAGETEQGRIFELNAP